ncbi:MAG: delta-60 repeat domain-containing protein, partial [Dokdonella sp.]
MTDIGIHGFARLAGWCAGLAAALVFTSHAHAQTGSDGFAADITSGSVHEVAVDNDGKIMLGGNFALASGIRRVARVFPDGSRDTDFTFGITATAGVARSILPISSGYLIGGSFTGGSSPDFLAQLDANGANVAGLGTTVNGAVQKVARRAASNGYLIAGDFTTVNGAGRNRVARMTSALTSDISFNPPAFYGTANDVLESPDGKVYVAGSFFGITGNIAAGYAVFRLMSNGTLDTTFTFDAVPQGIENVLSIALQPDGKLLIAGNFTATVGAEQRRRIARLNTNGSVDLTFQGPTLNDGILDMAVQPDGRIVIAGPFTGVGLGSDIARLHADGAVDSSFSPLVDPDNIVRSVAVQADGGVLFAGDFTSISGAGSALRVARIPKTGGLERNFAPGGSTDNDVNALAVMANGDVLAGGSFTSIAGDARTYLARFLGSTGALAASFTPTLNGVVNSVVIQTDGKFLVGGAFTLVNGATRRRIARFNADGTLDGSFVPADIPNGSVLAIGLDPNGRIYVGGSFQSVGGVSRPHLVRLLADGSVDSAFADRGVNGTVRAVAMALDQQKVYIGGDFTRVHSRNRYGFARMLASGDMDSTYQLEICETTSDPPPSVHTIAVPAVGGVVFGGEFVCVGRGIYNLAGFTEDGQLGLKTGQYVNGAIRSIQLLRDGRIHVAGVFTQFTYDVFTTVRLGLARIVPRGTIGDIDPTFDVQAITPVLQPAYVNTQVMQGDGRLVVGGRFEVLGGAARSNIGRIGNHERVADEVVSLLPGGAVQWRRSVAGAVPELLAPPQLLMSTTCCSASSFTPLPGTMTWSSSLGGSWRYDTFPTVFGTYYLRTRARIGDSHGGSLY